MTDIDLAARGAALDLLEAVLRHATPLDEALDAHPGLGALAARDRAFAHAIAATVLRRLGQIDALIGHCLDAGKRPKGDVVDILRVGTAQLLFLGTAPHAAVDTAVRLAEERRLTPFKGLVNAVLRRLGREGPDLVARQDAGRLNTPDWLWLAWRRAYGTARTRAIVEAHLAEAPLDLTIRADPALWAERLEATLLPTGSLRRPAGGGIAELPGFAEGAWWVQDAAAALPARLLGDVAGKRVVDLCAAPGGKTAQLAAAGARVVAVDRSARRLERLAANLKRLNLEAETVVGDAARWQPDAPADAVLVDAPCTATGTIRRNPDIQRLKTEDDVARLAAAQRRILSRAIEMVRPGGTIVYCTCSLQPEEGEHQIASLLAADDRVSRRPIDPAEIGGLAELVNPDGDLRTLPFMEGGMDGFFAARLTRR